MKKIQNPAEPKPGPALVRKANIEQVLRLMRQADTFSKVDLARDSGISTTTMTKLFNQLEQAGLIEKDRLDRESFGRPRTLYRLATAKVCVMAAVIDIDETTVATFSLNGAQNQAAETTFPTGSSLDGFYDRLTEALREARNTDGRKCLLAAVCLPGLIDRRSGKSVFCPNIHWLENTAPAKEVAARLKFQARVLHEEKALSLTNENGQQNFLLLDFSSGVGAGVVCDGKLLSGHSGFAGEIGHITVEPDGQLCGCGNRGCLETVASDRAFFQALESSSKEEAAERVLKYQAIGLAAAINLFNPQAIYVHTALSREVPDYLERIREQTKARALAPAAAGCTIELAEASKLQGTALHAIDRALQATTA